MRITVVYMGGSRVQAGCSAETVELPSESTVSDAVAYIISTHQELEPLVSAARWAVNFEFESLEHVLQDGDELALLPPVSGGAPRAVVQDQPLDPTAIMSRVSSESCGAVVLFVGTVRNHTDNREVQVLEYEAYEPMATRQLDRIATSLSSTSCEVYLAHRTGRLTPGEASIVIAAASPHRQNAYEASRQALELVKQVVPIWKKECFADGSQWVGWGGG